MPEPDETEQIRAAMSIMGKRKTAKKAASSAANIAKATASNRKEESEIACTCGRDAPALEHAWSCKRRRWADARKRRQEAGETG